VPKTRLKALFELLVEVPMTTERAVFTMPLPEDESERQLVTFDAAMLVRGTNALKAVRLLCEQAHWEFAAGILRQLFEQVINMEHLADQPDRDAAIFRYAKFGLYQKVLHQHLNLLYDQKTVWGTQSRFTPQLCIRGGVLRVGRGARRGAFGSACPAAPELRDRAA